MTLADLTYNELVLTPTATRSSSVRPNLACLHLALVLALPLARSNAALALALAPALAPALAL